jgi:molecular chaperone DnaJ
MTVAALGGEIEVPTLDGPVTVAIEPGTQSGHIEHLKNRGMPHLRGRGRGELVVLLRVETPTELSAEEEELLARFAELRNERTGEGRSVFDKIKQAFQ